jgi:protocatechuate 3,4-dioxygenase beta subunit
MKVRAILPAWMVLAGVIGAQDPSAKSGSVDGTVTNSVTGEPVKKAAIILDQARAGMNATVGVPRTAISDARGRFHFDGVEPGSYRISAQHDAFIPKRGWWQPSPPLTVAEEQHVQDVTIQLVPMGVVSGHVLDEDGDPIVGARVTILQYSYGPRRKRLGAVGQVESNDLGEFEALDLAPGRYYFQVAVPQPRNIPRHTRWAHAEEAYPATFYPNAREIGQATATDVAPGAHLNNIDFRLRKMPAYHIRGTVVGIVSGPGAPGLVVVESPEVKFQTNTGQATPQRDGSFDVQGVVSGSYEVSYRSLAPGSYSSRSVGVADADVNAVVLAREAEVSVSGTVTVEDPQPKALKMRINLSPIDAFGGQTCEVGPDGRFRSADVQPQIWELDIQNVPAGKYVKSIRFGDREIRNGEIDLSGGASASLNIVLGSDGGEVDGNVQTASGQPAAATEITLAPAEEYGGRADLLKRASTDAFGNFHLKDVAPGEYQVFAWESDPDGGSVRSAEFRKPFESKSAAVTVGPKDKASVQLSVITDDDIAKERSRLP